MLPTTAAVKLIGVQVRGDIQEYLIDGVYMDVLRADVFLVNGENMGADLLVQPHPWRRNNVRKLQGGVGGEDFRIKGSGSEVVFAVLILWQHTLAECNAKSLGIDLLDALDYLEQTGAAGNAMGLQGGRYRQADGFLCASGVRNNEICRERVKVTGSALDRSVIA